MKISKETRRLSREMMRWSITDGKLDAARVRHVTAMVCAEKPRHYVAVLKEYSRLIRLKVAERHATIESAVTLDHDAAETVVRSIHQRFGDDITSEFKVSPELIGGLRVKIGSDVWDGSVRDRLERLKEQL